jgi:hypothetical protein
VLQRGLSELTLATPFEDVVMHEARAVEDPYPLLLKNAGAGWKKHVVKELVFLPEQMESAGRDEVPLFEQRHRKYRNKGTKVMAVATSSLRLGHERA